MKQLSLVAFHGAKPPAFGELIRASHEALRSGLRAEAFAPYRMAQVHATIAGMERLDDRAPPISRNLWRKRQVEAVMEFRGLREVVARHLPLSIRFGGFTPAARDFASRGAPPYERSFRIQLAAGRATLIGWPHRAFDFGRRSLAELRADLARTCAIEHKYDDDNDLFVVLGTLYRDAVGCAPDVERMERTMRERLAARPLELELGVDRLHIVCYESESLDPRTTTAYALDDPRLTPEFLIGLYQS